MTPEEVKAKADAVNKELGELKALVGKAISKDDLEIVEKGFDKIKENSEANQKELVKLETALKVQGEALQGLVNANGEYVGTNKNLDSEFKKAFMRKEVAKEIQSIVGIQKGDVNILTMKAVGEITTANATVSGTVPTISHIVNTDEISNDQYRGSWLDQFMSVGRVSKPFWSYSERAFGEGAATHVAEGGTKPQIDADWVTRYAVPRKVAAYEIFTEESTQDIPGLMDYARTTLMGEVDYEYTSKVLKGAGTGEDPTGIITGASAVSVPTSLANAVNEANLYDVISVMVNAVAIAKGEKYMPHRPNLAMVHPTDLLGLQLKKDANNNYIMPIFNSADGTRIGDIVVRPDLAVTAGTVIVGDFKKANVKRYIDYNVRLGYINAQLIENKLTMVGEKRYMYYIKNLDSTAFVKGDIATVKAALETA